MSSINNGYKIGVLACGTMGTAVLNAMLANKDNGKAGEIVPAQFSAAVSSDASATRLTTEYGSQLTVYKGDNNTLVEQSDIILLGCKPYMAEKILAPIPKELFKGKIIVSLLAGKTIATLNVLTGSHALIARAMTNTPSKIGSGMTVVSFPESVEIDQSVRSAVEWIFNNTGKCLFLDEKQQDVATALCGSGPAFCYLMMEAMIDGAVKMGMPYELARQCASQVMKGAADMVQTEDKNPAVLRTNVCTPGGTTISGLAVLEDKGVRSAVARSVEEATNVATRLGKK